MATEFDLVPCGTCPWRVDKDATVIPRYSHEKACNLMNTVGRGDGFRPIMACHHSTGSEEPAGQACRGYLAQVGWTNINVRILLTQGKLPSPDECWAECAAQGVKLESNYETVLEKLAASVTE